MTPLSAEVVDTAQITQQSRRAAVVKCIATWAGTYGMLGHLYLGIVHQSFLFLSMAAGMLVYLVPNGIWLPKLPKKP